MSPSDNDKTGTKAATPAPERAKGDAGWKQDYVERAVAWSKAFNARTKHNEIDYDEKAFIDSLYEED